MRVIKVVPNTNDYKKTLKRFKGYYCPILIGSYAKVTNKKLRCIK